MQTFLEVEQKVLKKVWVRDLRVMENESLFQRLHPLNGKRHFKNNNKMGIAWTTTKKCHINSPRSVYNKEKRKEDPELETNLPL